jgi:hypothetical protein
MWRPGYHQWAVPMKLVRPPPVCSIWPGSPVEQVILCLSSQ